MQLLEEDRTIDDEVALEAVCGLEECCENTQYMAITTSCYDNSSSKAKEGLTRACFE